MIFWYCDKTFGCQLQLFGMLYDPPEYIRGIFWWKGDILWTVTPVFLFNSCIKNASQSIAHLMFAIRKLITCNLTLELS